MNQIATAVGNSNEGQTSRYTEQGFTLIELMIALMIFAMLALAGWQIMDSVTKSRDKGKLHQQALSQLDYAYLQLSQDLAQTTNYVAMPTLFNASNNSGAIANPSAISPTFELTAQQIGFIRFAAPDPRYQPAPVLAKVQYSVVGEKLTKQRFYQLSNDNENPATSVLLTGVKDASWKALTPDVVSYFPDEATLQKVQQRQAQKQANQGGNAPVTPPSNSFQNGNGQANNPQANNPQASSPNSQPQHALDLTPYQQLPRGVELSFTYQGEPITWRFALPNMPPDSAIFQSTQ